MMSDENEDFVKLNALRVDAIYNNAATPVIVMLCGALGLLITLWDEKNIYPSLIWFTSIIIITFIRYMIVTKYHNSQKLPEQYSYWLNIYIAGTFISAIVWGTTVYVLSTNSDIINIGLVTMFMLILLAGSIGIYSVFQQIYYALSLPAITPLIFYLLFHNNEQINKLGIITIIFTAFIFIIQYHSHKIINQLLVFKYDNKLLLDNYEHDQNKISVLEQRHNATKKELNSFIENNG